MKAQLVAIALLVSLAGTTVSAFDLSAEGLAPTDKIAPRLAGVLGGLSADDVLHVIVETDGASAEYADDVAALGFELVWQYDIIDGLSLRLPVRDLPLLEAQPWVERVWDSRPVVPLMDISAHDIQAVAAWNAGYNGAGSTVAVIDTGIDRLDPAFSGAIVSCVAMMVGRVVPECSDSDGHGTHVAGTVASRDAILRGIAWGAQLAVVRVLHAGGVGTSADIIAGMNWVRAAQTTVVPNIRVATMSIGFLDPGCGNGNDPEAQAADALVASGVSFTIAAGNAGHNTCTVDGASAAFNVVTVGAVDDRGTMTPSDDLLAGFSSGGPTTDGRLKPEISAPGVRIRSVYLGPTTQNLDGTSMATPHVAGAIAVLLQKEPTLSPATIKTRITSNAVGSNFAPSLPNNDWGHGIVNVCNMLGLSNCAGAAPPPVAVHVDAITMSFAHGNGQNGANKHTVTTVVTVRDANGALAPGVTVSLTTTSSDGNSYPLTGSTGSNGQATLAVTQTGGGHGTWQSCVTSLSGSYNSGANVETCDTLSVN